MIMATKENEEGRGIMKRIYLAGGCFWGMQRFLDGAEGVTKTEVGYANGRTDRPTYQEVKSQTTGYAETVKADYDERVLPTERLVRRFLEVIDPFAVNRQGEDEGEQYRTGIYFENEEDRRIAEEEVRKVEEASGRKCAVEVAPLSNYWTAEEYHQKYLEKHPNGYCHIFVKF